MKKLLLLASFTFLSMQAIRAQTQFGIRGGLNLSNIAGDAMGNALRSDIHLGVLLKMKLVKSLYWLPEVQYSAQGAQSPNKVIKAYYNYLNIPVMLRFYPNDKVIFLEAGLQLGLLLSAKVSNISNTVRVKKEVRKEDFALNVGLGARFNSHIELDVRGIFGMSNTSLLPNPPGKYPNRVFQVSLQANL
ncbi:MAG TPA: porin family protein [Saprospiraceae bacterium]|nr:porin family protein [Saprospiraceae bacterium]